MANVVVNRSNRLGFPLIEAQSVATVGTVTTVSFNNHVNVNDNFTGGFWVKFPSILATSTNTVEFATIGVSGSTPAYDIDGNALTVAGISSASAPTYHMFFYDRVSNRLQLIG